MSSETTIDKAQDPESPTTSVLKAAMQNLFVAIREAIETEAMMLSEAKAEASGASEFNPFVHYESKREILGVAVGILNQIAKPHELEDVFTNYLIDKMLPESGAGKEVSDLGY